MNRRYILPFFWLTVYKPKILLQLHDLEINVLLNFNEFEFSYNSGCNCGYHGGCNGGCMVARWQLIAAKIAWVVGGIIDGVMG